MLPFITAQVLLACYAYFIANKEAAYLKERQYYVPINSPFDDPFHSYGAWAKATVIVFAVVSVHSFWAGVILGASGSLILWVLYDVIVGKEVWDNPYYLGTTSKVDTLLTSGFTVTIFKRKVTWKGFGEKAGQRKVQIAGAVVVILNLLFLFL